MPILHEDLDSEPRRNRGSRHPSSTRDGNQDWLLLIDADRDALHVRNA